MTKALTHEHIVSRTLIGSFTCQSNVGGVDGSRSGEQRRQRSCQTPTVVWNDIGGAENIVLCSLMETATTETDFWYTLRSQPFELVNRRYEKLTVISALVNWVEFCWQTSQSASHWASCVTKFATSRFACRFRRNLPMKDMKWSPALNFTANIFMK